MDVNNLGVASNGGQVQRCLFLHCVRVHGGPVLVNQEISQLNVAVAARQVEGRQARFGFAVHEGLGL